MGFISSILIDLTSTTKSRFHLKNQLFWKLSSDLKFPDEDIAGMMYSVMGNNLKALDPNTTEGCDDHLPDPDSDWA